MGAIFNLLEQHRLHSYYNQFLQMGVRDERDFLDGVTDEDLKNMGLTSVEKNRFAAMKSNIQRLRAPVKRVQSVASLKSLASFRLQYVFPKCPEPKLIQDMDPAQNTLEDLMLRICHQEGIDNSRGVCLFSADGMPLTDDPFFNTWSLRDRHIENGATIYAIFTPKENLELAPRMEKTELPEISGEDTIRCHVMLKGDFEVMVNLESDTITSLKHKLANISGIPAKVLQYRGSHAPGEILKSCRMSEGSTAAFSLSTFPEETLSKESFFINDVVPSVTQTQKGNSVLLASLHVIKVCISKKQQDQLIAYIRKLTGCNPLAQGLHQLICRNEMMTKNQKVNKIAVIEGLYTLFRELLPQKAAQRGEKVIEDQDVFEESLCCWAYLLSEAEKQDLHYENYAPVTLQSEDGHRLCEPVKVPGVPGAFERSFVLQKIKDGEKIPNCTEEILRETSLQRDTNIEKILLSLPPTMKTYPLWIHHDKTIGDNFQVTVEETFGGLLERLKDFPFLQVKPPLSLKMLGLTELCLVQLNEDNLGVFVQKDKMQLDTIQVHDCLTGKVNTVDVNMLAARTGDQRDDHTFVTTRTPKEAILVLIDTSSSMRRNFYGDAEIQKINVVKELFDNFATRTMAYDFPHIIGLVQYDANVKTIHTFTENLEKFRERVRSLVTRRCTVLYDALKYGLSELEKVKARFPDCRLRIICLTDGKDFGSTVKPVDVTAKLLYSNIIVDSILIGNQNNNMLHGISNATGGCCFKPKTIKDGLKLFEIETVLSLELRKPKKKLDPDTLTESKLLGIFATHGYEEHPEISLPSQMSNKVTVTENALKKKIQESKVRTFMEKEKRIMGELRNLHCDPHPFIRVFPSESDITFWKILMQGPPDTPYEKGVFELYCQFGRDYPVKPPLVRFVTSVYHCNINNVGRICHNIFDRNYNAHITMREILDAVFGLLIIPEPDDPLDSILAEEFLTNNETYKQNAKKHTEETAGSSMDDMERKFVGPVPRFSPQHLICPLTKKLFVDPVRTPYGTVYERKAIEEHLKLHQYDPVAGKGNYLQVGDLKPDWDIKKIVVDHRSRQLE